MAVLLWPFLFVESTYEGEHNASELQIRRQAWWSVLCGANGHCMGNNPIWLFWDGWEAALDLPASEAMARLGAFFRALPWAELVPDTERGLVTGGLGGLGLFLAERMAAAGCGRSRCRLELRSRSGQFGKQSPPARR